MKKTILVFGLCVLFLFGCQVSFCNGAIIDDLAGQTFGEIVVFGASLADNGNAYAATGQPTAPYWEGRFSNGPVWVEYLAGHMGLSDQLNDMAVGGATSEDIFDNQVIPYTTNNAGQGDSLYILQSGNNDFIKYLELFNPTSWIAPAIDNIEQSINALYDGGARHIVVANAPNYGVTPAAHKTGNAGIMGMMTDVAIDFNNELADLIGDLEIQNDEATFYLMDFFALTNEAVTNPGQYGLTNVTDAWLDGGVGNLDEYVFFDDIHPTTRIHSLIVPEPTTLIMFVTGSCLMLRRRKK